MSHSPGRGFLVLALALMALVLNGCGASPEMLVERGDEVAASAPGQALYHYEKALKLRQSHPRWGRPINMSGVARRVAELRGAGVVPESVSWWGGSVSSESVSGPLPGAGR